MTPPRSYTADDVRELCYALSEIEAEASDQLSEIDSLDTVDLHTIPATDELRRTVRLLGCLRRLVVGRTPQELHEAFGAPGDWGYEIPLGDALYKLYRGGAT